MTQLTKTTMTQLKENKVIIDYINKVFYCYCPEKESPEWIDYETFKKEIVEKLVCYLIECFHDTGIIDFDKKNVLLDFEDLMFQAITAIYNKGLVSHIFKDNYFTYKVPEKVILEIEQ